MKGFNEGDEVAWNWGNGTATGTVQEIHTDSVSRTINGSTITRHGDRDCPAYVIDQKNGGTILKLHSEVSAA